MSGIGLDVTNNVHITVYDSQHRIKQNIYKHNKANRNLVRGLIKFLRGEFNTTNASNDLIEHNQESAKAYIPTFISFGDANVKQLGTTITGNNVVTTEEEALSDISNITKSKFNTIQLGRELVGNSIGNPDNTTNPMPKAHRCSISRSSYTDDITDSITLRLTSIVETGYYSKYFYQETTYKKARGSDKPIYLSELGLWASDFDGSNDGYKGNLLAKVTFDYNQEKEIDTIVRQTNSDIIKVDWKIEITSLDENFIEYNEADSWYNN
jgi:hypothetical protein